MSKESALMNALQANPQAPEAKASPVVGEVPENVKEEANPQVEKSVVPLNQIAKKEQKLLEEREAFKREQEEARAFLQKEREEVEDMKKRLKDFKDKAEMFETTRKNDPLKALKELGFTEKEIIDFLSMEDERSAMTPEERATKAAEDAIKKFQEEEKKKADEIKAKQDQEVVQKFKENLKSVVEANPEKYELCAYHGDMAEEIMFELALEEARQGKTPDPESLAQEVEDFYFNQFEAMKKLKKLTPRQEAALEAKKEQEPERKTIVHPPADITKPKATTLSNRLSATSAGMAKPSERTESREEKRARLEAIIRKGFIK